MRRWLSIAAVLALIPAPAARADRKPPPAAGTDPLVVLSHAAVYSPRTGDVTFTVAFNHQPDLTRDEHGRGRDEFQFHIYGDATQPYPAMYDSIVRGGEMTSRGSKWLLPIRSSGPTSGDPAASGWGPIRMVVRARMRGGRLQFSAPLPAVSDHSRDGRFTYELLAVRYGLTSDSVVGESTVRRRR